MNCQRCGTCCEKGGPALHRQDRHLVESGMIPASCLFTIRKGELARDNVKGVLVPMTAEVIKVKGREGRWTCHFYDRDRRGCGIYDHRPVECRALDCRDTHAIEAVYDAERLTREDLFAPMAGLWELVVDHDTRCGYGRLRELVNQGLSGRRLKMEAAILEIVRYDVSLRQLTVDTGGMDAGMLDFVFGRPLAETIAMFDLRLIKEDDRYGLAPTAHFLSVHSPSAPCS